jgi:hypothetical protein
MATSTVPYAVVVDDDLFILMHACDILEEAGFVFTRRVRARRLRPF